MRGQVSQAMRSRCTLEAGGANLGWNDLLVYGEAGMQQNITARNRGEMHTGAVVPVDGVCIRGNYLGE